MRETPTRARSRAGLSITTLGGESISWYFGFVPRPASLAQPVAEPEEVTEPIRLLLQGIGDNPPDRATELKP